MPLHMSEESKWQLLIDSIIGEHLIAVKSVSNNDIAIVGNEASIRTLKDVLYHQDNLKSKVLHAVRKPDQDSVLQNDVLKIADANHFYEIDSKSNEVVISPELLNLPNLTVVELLLKIFDPQYLKDLHIFPESLGNALSVTVLEAQFNSPSSARSKIHEGAWTLIQQNLVDIPRIIKILKGQEPLINSDTDADIQDSLLQLTSKSNTLQIKLNFGPVIQSMFKEFSCTNPALPPVIVQPLHENDQNVYVISKDHILTYMAQASGGIIGHPEPTESGDQGVRPLMIPQQTGESYDSLELYLVLDKSASMKDHMSIYKQQVGKILSTIANTVDILDVVVVPFSDGDTQTSLHCREGNIESVIKYLDTLQACGNTNLFGTVHKYLTQIKQSKSPNKAIIVVTDGHHNTGECTEQDVMKVVSGCDRDTSLSIYSIGVDQYDPRLKGALESAGAIHMDISNVNGLHNEFSAYANLLALPKVIYTFICEGKELLDQAVSGTVTVSDNVLPVDSTVQVDGQLYHLVTEEIQQPEDNISSSNDSLDGLVPDAADASLEIVASGDVEQNVDPSTQGGIGHYCIIN